MKTLVLLIALSLLIPASAPSLDADCQRAAIHYQGALQPADFSARLVIDSASLPLDYAGKDIKGYVWTATLPAVPGAHKLRGLLQHKRLDFVMQTQVVRIECVRAFANRR